MPQIKEYNQQVSVQGGFNTAQISPEAATQEGRGIQQIGAAIGNIGEVVQQRNDMMQTSDASTKFSELRTAFTKKIKQQSDDGTIDSDKILQDYQAEYDKLAEQYDSPVAQKFVRSAGDELKSSIATHSFAAQSELARVAVLENHQKKMANFRETLAIDPSQYVSIQKQHDEWLSSLPMGAKQLEKLKYDDMKQLSIARLRGQIALTPSENLLKLKAAIGNGTFKDQYLDDVSMKDMQAEVSATLAGREADMARLEKLNKENKSAQEDFAMNKYLSDLSGNHQYNSKNYLNDPSLSPEKKMSLNNFALSFNKKSKAVTDNSMFNEAYKRMILPDGDPNKIYTIEQLQPYIENADAKDAKWLIGALSSSGTPESKLNAKMKSIFYDAAKAALGIDPLTKIADPEKDKQLAALTQEFETTFAKKRQDGITAMELLDPKGKNSLYPIIDSYRRSLNDRLKSSMQNMKNQTGTIKVKPNMSPAEFLKQSKENK